MASRRMGHRFQMPALVLRDARLRRAPQDEGSLDQGQRSMSEVLIQDTTIAARDGYALAASVFVPEGRPSGAVLINSATAVPRKIYRGFAGYLASQGFAVVTYDYRGTGGSRPASLRG